MVQAAVKLGAPARAETAAWRPGAGARMQAAREAAAVRKNGPAEGEEEGVRAQAIAGQDEMSTAPLGLKARGLWRLLAPQPAWTAAAPSQPQVQGAAAPAVVVLAAPPQAEMPLQPEQQQAALAAGCSLRGTGYMMLAPMWVPLLLLLLELEAAEAQGPLGQPPALGLEGQRQPEAQGAAGAAAPWVGAPQPRAVLLPPVQRPEGA